jgi:subtilisin family serine protease
MTHRVAGGRRLRSEPLEQRLALSAQAVVGADGIDPFRTLYPAALDQSDPVVRAVLERITTTASDATLSFSLDPVDFQIPAFAGGDVETALVQSAALIGLDDFRNDVRFAGVDGRGFSVVVLDTGVDLAHPFFGPDADHNGVADRIVYSADFVGDRGTAQDAQGHGTHVSSIAVSQNPTYMGMAPGANLIHLRVLNDAGNGSAASIEAALQWAVANVAAYNIASVNMSFSTLNNYSTPNPRADFGITDEIAALAAQNVIVAAAAGNAFFQFDSAPGVAYPAADPNSLAVSAVWDAVVPGPVMWNSGAIDVTTGPDRLPSFAQRHPTLTSIFAPGAAITAAAIGGGVQTFSGTSMAAPHIAGLAAVFQQLAIETTGQRLTPTQFKNLLAATGLPIFDGDDEDDNVSNTNAWYRRVDVMEAAAAILTGGQSDLTLPRGVSLENASVAAGGAARLNSLVANQGLAATGAFTTKVYLSADAVVDASDLLLATLTDSIVGGGFSLWANTSAPVPADLAPGNYYVVIVVDSGQTVAESNEANNVAAAAITITASRPEVLLTDAIGAVVFNSGLSTVDFGAVDQHSADIVKTFRIANDGSEDLTLGNLAVPAGFEAQDFPTLLHAGESALFTIRLPAGNNLGVYGGQASFSSNDTDENPFTLTLTGRVVEPDDHGNDAETATIVTMPAIVPGKIFDNGETDWFRIQAASGVSHRFETILGTLADSILRVYDSDGVTLLASDDDGGPGLASLLTWIAPHDGAFYLEVARKGSAAGTYQLALSPADDHGNSAATATPITDPSHTPGVIEAVGDVDWFSFVALAGVEYHIAAPSGSLTGSSVRLLDVDGHSEILANIADAAPGGIVWTAPSNGTFYISVQSATPSGLGTYMLALTGDDDYGDNAANAAPLAVPGAIAGDVETADDVDWFAVHAVAGTRYQFAVTLGTLGHSLLRVIDRDGAIELARDGVGGFGFGSFVVWTAPANGDYFLEVSGDGNSAGSYNLAAAIIDDHANSAAGATPITDPSTTAGVIELAGDVDWFAFHAFAGVEYRFEVKPTSALAAGLRLLDGTNVELAAAQAPASGQSAVVVWTAPSDGVYFVEIAGSAAGPVGSYHVLSTGDDDHGDNPQNATPLTIPRSTDGDIERPGDADWFSLATLPGLDYGVTVGLGTLPNVRVRVYAADGTTVVAEAVTAGEAEAWVQWTATGNQYSIEIVAAAAGGVSAASAGGGQVGDYRVTPRLLSALPGDYDGDADVDGNDFLAWQRLVGQTSLGAAALLDASGFEAYAAAPLEGQHGWLKLGAATGSAVVQSSGSAERGNVVRVDRGAGGDNWWGVPLGNSFPASHSILVSWDMKFVATGYANGALGPFLGVEAYDDDGAFGLLGTFGVDATTSDLIYQQQDTGYFVETGVKASPGVWHRFAIWFDFTNYRYTVFFNGQPLAATGFVDRGPTHARLDQFTDADIAAQATQGNAVSQAAAGTAYFDNFRILDGANGAYLPADGNHDGVVDALDLQVWKAHYGLAFNDPGVVHAAAAVQMVGGALGSETPAAVDDFSAAIQSPGFRAANHGVRDQAFAGGPAWFVPGAAEPARSHGAVRFGDRLRMDGSAPCSSPIAEQHAASFSATAETIRPAAVSRRGGFGNGGSAGDVRRPDTAGDSVLDESDWDAAFAGWA